MEEIRSAFWRYRSEENDLFPETAIPGNQEKQNFSVFPRKLYVDVRRRCRDCNRAFIFFAQEQKHWFEDLNFYVDADCVHCADCRKKHKRLRRAMERYSRTVKAGLTSPEQILGFAEDSLLLVRLGGLKRPTKLFEALKKLATMGAFDDEIQKIKDEIAAIARNA